MESWSPTHSTPACLVGRGLQVEGCGLERGRPPRCAGLVCLAAPVRHLHALSAPALLDQTSKASQHRADTSSPLEQEFQFFLGEVLELIAFEPRSA